MIRILADLRGYITLIKKHSRIIREKQFFSVSSVFYCFLNPTNYYKW